MNGKITHNLDANLTAITHIPEARLIITLRLEASLLRMSRNISIADGQPYAQRSEDGHGVDFIFRYCNAQMAVVEGVPIEEMLNRSILSSCSL